MVRKAFEVRFWRDEGTGKVNVWIPSFGIVATAGTEADVPVVAEETIRAVIQKLGELGCRVPSGERYQSMLVEVDV